MTDQDLSNKGVNTDINNLLEDINMQELVYHDVSVQQQLDSIRQRWPLVKELAERDANFGKKDSSS